jgi:hypothetical protein
VVSITLFVLITWVCPPSCLVYTAHSSPLQHLVIDIIRLYIAFHKSETDQGADLFYIHVASMTSIMKTSVYLVETIVSDLFIVRLYTPVLLPCTDQIAPPAISVLYCMEREHPRDSYSSHSIYRRHWYASPSSQRRRTLNESTSFSGRDRGSLYPVAHWAEESCLRQEARASRKLILRLHSRLECCLHRYVPMLH